MCSIVVSICKSYSSINALVWIKKRKKSRAQNNRVKDWRCVFWMDKVRYSSARFWVWDAFGLLTFQLSKCAQHEHLKRSYIAFVVITTFGSTRYWRQQVDLTRWSTHKRNCSKGNCLKNNALWLLKWNRKSTYGRKEEVHVSTLWAHRAYKIVWQLPWKTLLVEGNFTNNFSNN